MKKLTITGKNPLYGSIKASGSKNSTTKLLVASLLSNKKSIFFNVPNIEDVRITVELCREVGAECTWNTKAKIIEIQTKEITNSDITRSYSGSCRIPILMLGALLGRSNTDIKVPAVGGCKIGQRPLDFHLKSLTLLGAQIETIQEEEAISYRAKVKQLRGTIITLDYPSIGATENTIFAACRAKGSTVIKNAAIESEIIDLILYLQKIGVNIHIDVDRTIHIEETTTFYPTEHTIIPDRNEIVSFALAAIGTKGKVLIKDAQQLHLITFLNKLREVNGGFRVCREGIEFFYQGPIHGGLHLETDVHPGFMTDWQQPFSILLTQAEGLSIIHETVYENRFGYTHALNKMGAKIQTFHKCLGSKPCRFQHKNFPHSIVIHGPTPLFGTTIKIPDLRAGFAYIMAALIAEGETTIEGLEFIYRGYEDPELKLSTLGAQIKTVSEKPALV